MNKRGKAVIALPRKDKEDYFYDGIYYEEHAYNQFCRWV